MNINMNINMDSFVNKLRNTVSNVAYSVNSSVNTVIPGNLIQREYDTIKKRCVHGCPGFYWDIYDAVKRDSSIIPNSFSGSLGPIVNRDSATSSTFNEPKDRSTNQEVDPDKKLYSVFIFEKRQLDRLTKTEKDLVIDHMKKSVTQLTRLRHPSILTVHHSLEESRSTLAFVTEHIFGNLHHILKLQKQESQCNSGNYINKQTGSLVEIGNRQNKYLHDTPSSTDRIVDDNCFLDTVQIKAGLLQVCDGLKFLHQDAKMMHRNLCLENIFINSNNVWKIGGFDFCCTKEEKDTDSGNALSYEALREVQKVLPSCITPNWSCTAPEHSNNSSVTVSADIYSLGLIASAAFNWNDMNIDISYEAGLVSDTYKRGLACREIVDRLPANMKSELQKFTTINVATRPSLDEFQKLSIFNDAQVQTLRYLDANFTWDNFKKIQFYESLESILPKLSHQVKVNRVASALVRDFMNIDMLPHVLTNYLLIVQESHPMEFKAKLLPPMKKIFTIVEPSSVPSMLLKNLPMLSNLSKNNSIESLKELSLPLIYRSLQSNNCQIQEQCLTILPLVKPLLDTSCLKDNLLPILHHLCNSTNILAVRVKCLVCIGKLIDIMESWLIVEKVIPILRDIPSREPAVIMSTVGIIKLVHANSKLTKETIANSIVSILFPLSIDKELNLQQFQTIIQLVKHLVEKVEEDQTETLKKLNKVEDSTNKYTPMVLSNSGSKGLGASMDRLSDGAANHIKTLALLD